MCPTTPVSRRTFSRTVSGNTWAVLTSALCYHGRLRVGTGLSLLDGMNDLQKNAEQLNLREYELAS